MRTEKEIIDDIAKLTIEIRDKYPEMAKYLNEMTVTNPDIEHPRINVELLNDYYETLKMMIDKYAKEHLPSVPKENLGDEKL
jgi:hypothetical protein